MRRFTFREQLRLASAFLAGWRQTSNFTAHSPAAVRAYQLNKLKTLVRFAFENVELYRRRYAQAGLDPSDIQTWEDFSNIPTISKRDLQEEGPQFISPCVNRNRLIVSKSSGSSGQLVALYLDDLFFIRQHMRVLRMLREFDPGYLPHHKEVLVYTSEFPVRSIMGLYPVRYLSNLAPVDEMFLSIRAISPRILAMYPSVALELLGRFGERCLDIKVSVLVTHSEQSSQLQRDRLAEGFGCAVYDEYSSEELSSIAHQCIHGKYHLTEDTSYVEILPAENDRPVGPGTLGEVTGTCLINDVMPIIRYRQGDAAAISLGSCACGRAGRFLSEFDGRRNSSFARPDGHDIPSGRLLDWTYRLVIEHRLDIVEFQLIQETLKNVTLYVVLRREKQSISEQDLARDFNHTFGRSFRFRVKKVATIQRAGSGKHIPIISLVHIR